MKAKKAEKKDLVLAACGVIWGETGVQKIKRLVPDKRGKFRVFSKGLFVEEEEGPGLWRHTVHFPETSPEYMSEAVA